MREWIEAKTCLLNFMCTFTLAFCTSYFNGGSFDNCRVFLRRSRERRRCLLYAREDIPDVLIELKIYSSASFYIRILSIVLQSYTSIDRELTARGKKRKKKKKFRSNALQSKSRRASKNILTRPQFSPFRRREGKEPIQSVLGREREYKCALVRSRGSIYQLERRAACALSLSLSPASIYTCST